ncbi:MAG: hypothetical protein MAG451_02862 [Anaerolineales bacterium]|nr:hypothetical protein [Anaerolineales bacterium]
MNQKWPTGSRNQEDLKNLAGNPDLISGIYNYCDRWCQRCPFTSRCMVFAMEEQQFDNPTAHDLNSEAFWQTISDSLQATLEMLQEMAEEQGIDLDLLDVEADMEEQRRLEEETRNHACARAAEAYAETVDAWFDSVKDLFVEKEDELNLRVRVNILGDDPHEEAASIEDAVEVIRWYQHQIHVKLFRALHGALEERPAILEDFPKDSDGSAKVALSAMDCSIAAWGELYRHFPMAEDDILDILVHLDRLRRATEQEFPDARAFVRPGFDEVEL